MINMMNGNKFGYFLKTTRLARNISGRELSRMAGIAQSTISDLEVGRRNPSPDLVYKICKALDIDVGQIYVETGKMPTDALEYIKYHPTAGILISRLINYKFSEKSLALLVEHVDQLYQLAQKRKQKQSVQASVIEPDIQDTDDVFEENESNDSDNVENLDDDFA